MNTNARTPYLSMAAALLALIGLFDAAYLALQPYLRVTAPCPTGGGCAAVAASPYSLLFDTLPVAVLGVIGYALLFGLAIASLHIETIGGLPVTLLLLLVASLGALMSVYLTYVQVALIGAVCFWCVLSALTQWVIWGLAWFNWRGGRLMQRPV